MPFPPTQFFIILIIWLVALGFLIYYVLLAIREKYARPGQIKIKRHIHNPVLSPLSLNDWETVGTFNPAAVEDDEGRIHLFYRAIGSDGLSRIGHSTGSGPLEFSERCAYPVFNPAKRSASSNGTLAVDRPKKYEPLYYTSGGGWGGCEDPRTVRIEDKIYMTYLSFEGWDDMRIAVTCISVSDLKKKHWKWKIPIMLSPAKERNKNWVLFPAKFDGKFALLHGINPNIRIEYVDSLDSVQHMRGVKSMPDHGGQGFHNKSRAGYWDEWVRGVGAPPLKTDKGWLVLYHAYDKRNPHKPIGYVVGAMLLDTEDPTKILYRSPEPILMPDMHYENDGKPGVVYASGAVIKDRTLYIYYGGGDKHACVAHVPVDELLQWLMAHGKVNS